MANVGIGGLLHSGGFDGFRRNQLAFLELILLAEHDGVVFAEPGEHLGVRRRLQAQLYFAPLEVIRRVYDQHRALTHTRGFDRLQRNGKNVGHRMQRDFNSGIHSRHEFVIRIRHGYFGVHRSSCRIDLI